MSLACELGLDPKQVAVWFQNRRARWKIKQLEEEYAQIKSRLDAALMEKCHFENESISGGRSLAQVVFDKLKEQSFGSTDVEFKGSSLLKMIKLLTFTICGRAYLNFMGNEFGHPNDMMKLDEVERILSKRSSNVHHVDESNMVIAYLRGPLLFVFNFHPEFSYEKHSIGVEEAGEYQIIFNTDELIYGGKVVVDKDQYLQRANNKRIDGCRSSLDVPLPCRSAQIYKLSRILRV